MKPEVIVLFIGFTIAMVSQCVAIASDATPARPRYFIFVNQGPDNDCVQGWVDMEVRLGPDDKVVNAIVISSHPNGLFDSAALERIANSRFSDAIALVDENRVLVVRIQYEISVYQLQRCLDALNVS